MDKLALITERYLEARHLNIREGNRFMIGQKFKKEREVLCLGDFCNRRKMDGLSPDYVYVVDGDNTRTRADFSIYDSDKNFICDLEVFELLSPERKRDEEYKKLDKSEISVMSFEPINDEEVELEAIRVLNQKLEKSKYYNNNTVLLIYENLLTFDDRIHKALFEIIESVYCKIEKSNLKEIWKIKGVCTENVLLRKYFPNNNNFGS